MAENVFKGERKADSFSLAWRPFIADEKHYEPHLSEKPNIQASGEIYERSVLQKSNGTEAGTTLNPLMPDVKRNKENNLAQFLEGNTLLNLTKLIGTEESKRPKNWKESDKQKDY
jgi:hypothetical protein